MIGSHDVDGNDAAVEVDGQALKADVGTQSLRSNAQSLGNLEQCRHCMCDEHLACWIKVCGDVVEENLLENLLRGLGRVLWDLLERFVRWGKDGVVRKGAVEKRNDVFIFVDQGSKLGGVLARSDQFLFED